MLASFLPYLAWELSQWEVYGLFFLLGSFVVATLSDLKTMTAQREFMDVWWAVALVLALVQWWQADWRPGSALVLKWALVAVFGLLSHRAIGLWLRLASADVAAIVAAAMLLAPGMVLVYFLLLKALAWPASKALARGKSAYPFMPVVTLATVAIVAVAFWIGAASA